VAYVSGYAAREPSREEVGAIAGPVLLEFGTPWCGFCRMAQSRIATALERHPAVTHLKVEDGSGRPLGRSFTVKLWPTLVFLRDGVVVDTLVRPGSSSEIAAALARIDPR
jgi:thioredoxin 1